MKKLIPTISKMAMGGEPPKIVKPIYVSSKNDPRLKSYQDSLSLYNRYPKPIKGTKTTPYNWKTAYVSTDNFDKDGVRIAVKITPTTRQKIEPIGFGNLDKRFGLNVDTKFTKFTGYPFYKKPVQPVEYKQAVTPTVVPKPKVTPKPIVKTTPKPVVSTKKIQMETTPINKKVLMETSKLDTTPINDRTLQMETTKLDSTPVNSKRLQMLTTKLNTINNKRKLQMQTTKIQ